MDFKSSAFIGTTLFLILTFVSGQSFGQTSAEVTGWIQTLTSMQDKQRILDSALESLESQKGKSTAVLNLPSTMADYVLTLRTTNGFNLSTLLLGRSVSRDGKITSLIISGQKDPNYVVTNFVLRTADVELTEQVNETQRLLQANLYGAIEALQATSNNSELENIWAALTPKTLAETLTLNGMAIESSTQTYPPVYRYDIVKGEANGNSAKKTIVDEAREFDRSKRSSLSKRFASIVGMRGNIALGVLGFFGCFAPTLAAHPADIPPTLVYIALASASAFGLSTVNGMINAVTKESYGVFSLLPRLYTVFKARGAATLRKQNWSPNSREDEKVLKRLHQLTGKSLSLSEEKIESLQNELTENEKKIVKELSASDLGYSVLALSNNTITNPLYSKLVARLTQLAIGSSTTQIPNHTVYFIFGDDNRGAVAAEFRSLALALATLKGLGDYSQHRAILEGRFHTGAPIAETPVERPIPQLTTQNQMVHSCGARIAEL